MKQILSILPLVLTLLSACYWWPVPDEIYPPEATETPNYLLTRTPPSPGPADLTAGTPLPRTSYESWRYGNEAGGFTLDVPTYWTFQETFVGGRASQVEFLSAPELADAVTLPEGGSRVTVVIQQWDPKDDLPAYASQRKKAWEASGFKILEEELLILDSGLLAVECTAETAETRVLFLVTALNDQYLTLNGEGDLALAKEILRTLRPISR